MKKISNKNASVAQKPGDEKSNGLVDMFDTLLEFSVPKQGMQYEIISDADDPVRIRTNALTTDGRSIEYTVVPDPTSEYTTSVDQNDYSQYVATILGPDNNGRMSSKLYKDGLYFSKDSYGYNVIPVNMKYVGDDSTFEKFTIDSSVSLSTNNVNTISLNFGKGERICPVRNLINKSVYDKFPVIDSTDNYTESKANISLFIDLFNKNGGYMTMARAKTFDRGVFLSLSPMYLYFGNDLSQLPDRIANAAIPLWDIYSYYYQNTNLSNPRPILKNNNENDFPTSIWLIPTGMTYFLDGDDYQDMFNNIESRDHLLYLPIKDGTPIGEVEFIMRTSQYIPQYDPRFENGQIPYYPTSIEFNEYFSYIDESTKELTRRATSYWLNDHTILNGIIYRTDPYEVFARQSPFEYEYHQGAISKMLSYVDIISANPVVKWLSETFTIVRPMTYQASGRTNPIGYDPAYIEYTNPNNSYDFKFKYDEWSNNMWIYTFQEKYPNSNFGTNPQTSMLDWTHDNNDTQFKSFTDYYGFAQSNDRYFNYSIVDKDMIQPSEAWTRVFTPHNNSSISSIVKYDLGEWGSIGISSILPWNSLIHNLSSWRLSGLDSTSTFKNFNISTFGDVLQSIAPMQERNYTVDRVNIMPSPFFQKIDGRKFINQYQRKYNPNEKMTVIPINASNKHYSNLLSRNDPVIFTSDVLEETVNMASGKMYSEDFLYSTFLTDDINLVNALIDNYNKVDPAKIVDDINKKYDEESKQDDMTITGLATIKSTISDLYKPTTPQLSPIFKDLYDVTGRRIVIDVEKFKNFRIIVAANSANEGIFGLAGHLRILMTNYAESPIFEEILQNGIHESEIKIYSRLSMSIISSMYGIDLANLLDSIDVANEVTLINSLVSNQLNVTYSLMDKIGNVLSDADSFDPQNPDHQKVVSDFANISNQVANDLLTTIGEFDQMMTLKELSTTSYNYRLLSRNVKNTTSYAKSLSDALRSDPYIALTQHSAYIKERLNHMSIKTGIIDSLTSGMDFIAELPSIIIEGLDSIKDIALTILKFAANTIGSTFKLIDNVDKLIFINETYLSKGIIEYSSIPTMFDDIITPPSVDNGKDSQYNKYESKAELILDIDTGFLSHLTGLLNNTKNNPIKVGDYQFSYNDYNIGNLISTLSGYYFPINGDQSLPLIIPVDNKTKLVPNLTHHVPTYPEKGNVLKLFLSQLGDVPTDNKVEQLSPYMPISDRIVGVYTGSLIGILAGSAIAGAAGGGFTDPISALIGAVGSVIGSGITNGMEMSNIIYRRHVMGDDYISVYGYAHNNYQSYYKPYWENKLTEHNQSFLSKRYIFILTEKYRPLFSEASNFKKTVLMFKEIIATIFNTIAMISVSYMIGKVAKVLVESSRKLSDRVNESRKRKFENKKTSEEAKAVDDAYAKDIDELEKQHQKNLDDTENDPDLSKEDKEELKQLFIDSYEKEHSRLTTERKDFAVAAKAKLKLNSTQYWRLSKELALKYDVPTLATTSTGSKLGILAGLGSLTASAISTFTTGFKNFISKLDPEDQESIETPPGLDGVLDLTSEIAKKLLAMSDDITIIKKYI